MRRLVLMRHAKSSWDSNSLSDHERPLSGRDQRDAPRVAEALVKLGGLARRRRHERRAAHAADVGRDGRAGPEFA